MGQLHQGVIKTGREVKEGKENFYTAYQQRRTHEDSHQVDLSYIHGLGSWESDWDYLQLVRI